MLKIKRAKILLICFFVISLMQVMLFAQEETVEQRRAREHQAVRDYIYNSLNNLPHTLNPTQSSIDKYDILNRVSNKLGKTKSFDDRKRYLLNGNNVAVETWNYGGIGPGYPGVNLRDILGMVWRDAPYIFQFTPFIAAEVPSAVNNQNIHIVSDGLYDYPAYRESDPQNPDFFWTWEPLPGYADPDQEYMASNPGTDSNRDGKPDSWPRDWYSEALGEYVWPGYLTVGVNNADAEIYWAMDDRYNLEFPYYPFVNDSSRKGLGIQIDGRAFQWSNSLASNAVFFVWTITNVSDKDLDTVLFGIYGDPDLGGGNPENTDDNGSFIPPFNVPNYPPVDNIPVYARSMAYFFDPDMTGKLGVSMGYLGCKFLESPGNDSDFVDNDGDLMIDESQSDGVDNDGDWNPETDDVGVDGIAGTGDFGEGDGIPTSGRRLADGRPDPLEPGEPNFEYTDLDEADQIGLSSFSSWSWVSSDAIKNDELVWTRNIPGNFSDIESNADIVFTFGSGYISLKKGETKRISMAFLFGETFTDLLTTAETVQDIYNKNYNFFKPPDKPIVYAVPDDKKVTLYWDKSAEESTDPITGKDFEGYVIYRSTRPDFADVLTISDGRGAAYLYEPLRDLNGFDAKWDLVNDWRGYHPIAYQGRGLHYYLGDNVGLVHSFVDSNNVRNGQTYYYAVVAYDHGDSLGIPPSETGKKISVDPISSEEILDVNTIKVIPGPRASGYNSPSITSNNILHTQGYGNGEVNFSTINELKIKDEIYTLTFKDTLYFSDTLVVAKNYSVTGEKSVIESFYLYGTKFTNLTNGNIIDDSFLQVKDAAGTIYQKDIDYEINLEKGAIKRTGNSPMLEAVEYFITYRRYAVYQSTALKGEDSNPVFDGVLLTINDFLSLSFNTERSKWTNSDLNINLNAAIASIGTRKKLYAGDYIITFSDQFISDAKKRIGSTLITIPVKYKVEEVSTGISIPIVTLLEEKVKNDSAWTRGDEIICFLPGAAGINTDTLTWGFTFERMTETDSVQPNLGDAYLFYTSRPFTKSDVYTLTTKSGYVSNGDAKDKLDNIYVVPNPYVGANEIEPANKLPSQNRGERRIYFENLPMKCTIRIYTLSGELVNTLEHESGADNGREFWNLLNHDGFSVAYGVYLAHIDAPGVGEKLIKFALIK